MKQEWYWWSQARSNCIYKEKPRPLSFMKISVGQNFVKSWEETYPTKHLCIFVPAPFWHLICINFVRWCRLYSFWCYQAQICNKFSANLALKFKRIMQKQHTLRPRYILRLLKDMGSDICYLLGLDTHKPK